MLQQTRSKFWWLENKRYFFYIVREITGPIIAFYSLYFVIAWWFDPSFEFMKRELFLWASRVTLGFAIIHSVTWLWITGKISLAKFFPDASTSLCRFFMTFWILAMSGFFFLLLGATYGFPH